MIGSNLMKSTSLAFSKLIWFLLALIIKVEQTLQRTQVGSPLLAATPLVFGVYKAQSVMIRDGREFNEHKKTKRLVS